MKILCMLEGSYVKVIGEEEKERKKFLENIQTLKKVKEKEKEIKRGIKHNHK